MKLPTRSARPVQAGQPIDPSSQSASSPQVQSSRTADAEQSSGLPRKRTASGGLMNYAKRLATIFPRPGQNSSLTSSSQSETSTDKAQRFKQEVESHCAELRRRDTDALGSPHSRLVSAVNTMFEFDCPALKEAVIFTLKHADPEESAISPDFDDVLDTIDAASRDSFLAPCEERLVKDVQTFRDLVDACHASPHREIRTAPASYLKKAVDIFIRQALAMTPEEQRATEAEKLRPVQEYFKDQGGSAGTNEDTRPPVEVAHSLLSGVCYEGCFSAEVRSAFHELGLSIVTLESDALFKANSTAQFARTVPGLPVKHQLEAFIRCVTFDQNTPADAAQWLLRSCVTSLYKSFDPAVGGKAAIEVVKAAGKYGDPETIATVMYQIESELVRLNPYANDSKSYFDSVPVDDRIEYFAEAMQAVLEMPGFDHERAVSMGLQIVHHLLPDGVVELAKDALYKAERGGKVDFQAEARSWKESAMLRSAAQHMDPGLAALGRRPSELPSSASTSHPPRSSLPLPDELIQEIASYLPHKEVYAASATSRDMYETLGHTRAVVRADQRAVRTNHERPLFEANIFYARRLHDANERDETLVNGQRLELTDIAHLSGASMRNMRPDPVFRSVPSELVPIRDAFPRPLHESNLDYARRLKAASDAGDPRMNGLRLSRAQMAELTGATQSLLQHQLGMMQ